MPSRKEYHARNCGRELVGLLEQVPYRAAYRWPMALDDMSVATLLLWTLLRWERNFLLICLEGLGTDMWQLTCQVDSLLRDWRVGMDSGRLRRARAETWSLDFRLMLDRHVLPWLDRAQKVASSLGHGSVGTEHLLLAILAHAEGRLAKVLTDCGVLYKDIEGAVLSLVPAQLVVADDRALAAPWGAGWDTKEAAGLPRRFAMAKLFLLVTLYAVLFATMQLLDAPIVVFVMITVLFAGVGLGQAFLFGGRYPRAASVWTGAFLLPLEMVVALAYWTVVERGFGGPFQSVVAITMYVVFSIPFGAGLGYLAGGVTAGVFVLSDLYDKWKKEKDAESSREKGAKSNGLSDVRSGVGSGAEADVEPERD